MRTTPKKLLQLEVFLIFLICGLLLKGFTRSATQHLLRPQCLGVVGQVRLNYTKQLCRLLVSWGELVWYIPLGGKHLNWGILGIIWVYLANFCPYCPIQKYIFWLLSYKISFRGARLHVIYPDSSYNSYRWRSSEAVLRKILHAHNLNPLLSINKK